MKCCFIVQYYGDLPVWFPLFLKSCEYNKEIDWLFFVDREFVGYKPSNVKFHLQPPTEFQKLCKNKLGHEVELLCYKGRKGKKLGYYKLCDFRPMYGLMFEDFLEEYDFWGWCDVDMVFGNVSSYINQLPNDLECISFADEPYPLPYGPCTMIKNNEKLNNLFQQSCDISDILTLQKHFHFDEDWTNDVDSIGHVMRRENIKYHRKNVGDDDGKNRGRDKRFGVRHNWIINWSNGKLFHRRREIMFFHFGQTKQWVQSDLNFVDVWSNDNYWFNYETLTME